MTASGDKMPDNLIGSEFDAEETDLISVGRLMWLPFIDEEGHFGLRPFVYAMESKVDAICSQEEPPLLEVEPGHVAACHFSDQLTLRGENDF